MSNFYSRPGKAGGLPILINNEERAMEDKRGRAGAGVWGLFAGGDGLRRFVS
jgi:hypothetical protein